MIRLLYRALLRLLLPATFRRRHGADMEEVFMEAVRRDRAPGGGRRRVAARLLREAVDLARTGAELRRRHARRGTGGGTMGRIGMLEGFGDDIRQAVRSLVRRPVFTLFAAGTLAVGVGATTAMFSALETLILNPLPYEGADRMVGLWRTFGPGGDILLNPSEPQVEAWGAQDDLFEGVEPVQKDYPTLTGLGDAAQVMVALVRPSYFGFLGIRPDMGRLFSEEDGAGEGAPVVLLGHHVWKERFGGAAPPLGRTVTLDGETFTVIGVMPPRLPDPTGMARRIDFYRPLPDARTLDRSMVVARLRPGVDVDDVRARMDLLAERAEREEAGSGSRWQGIARRTADLVGMSVRENLRVLMAAVVLLLLIACVNVSNLLLSRANRRARETAVRSALGAGRGRLIRELLVESGLLGLAGGALGVAIAWGAVRAMSSVRGDALDALGAVHLNERILAFALLTSLASTAVFGVFPALRAAGRDPGRTLGSPRGTGGRGPREGRAGWALLVAEIALSFALLVGATLVLRSLAEMRARDPGFRAEGLVAANVSLPGWKYEGEEARRPVYEAIRASVERLPGVEGVVEASGVPPESGIFVGGLEVEGGPEFEGTQLFYGSGVEPGWFALAGHRIVEGRGFNEEDVRSGASVAVLGESAARRLFPDGGAVGRRFKTGEWRTVVGVAEDLAHRGLSSPRPELQLLVPMRSDGGWFVVRIEGPPEEVLPAIRAEILGAEPDAAIMDLATVDGMLAATLGRERFTTALLAAFAVVALLLSAVGLYGVVSQVVGQRTREIGIRMALGAAAARVRAGVLARGLAATALGIAVGLGLAMVGLRLLESRVFGIEPAGSGTFAAAGAVLAAVALVACWIPARRAAAVQPSEALRSE